MAEKPQKGNVMADTKPAPANVDDGWQEVVTEGQVVFDTDGDEFIGQFTGWTETDNGIPQAHFKNQSGEYFTNCGWSLKMQLKAVKKGEMVRIRRTGTQDTGQPSPMVLFQVWHKAA
jgi:hypothetical protein